MNTPNLMEGGSARALPATLLRSTTLRSPARHGGPEFATLADLKPYSRNARTHSKKQIEAIAASMDRFGFTNPILITPDNRILAGHGRLEAAKRRGMTSVPVVRIENLSEADIRAYILADNKLAERAGWDKATLAGELRGLIDLGYDIELTGFTMPEIDLCLKFETEQDTASDLADVAPPPRQVAVSRPSDLWRLGPVRARHHRLMVGDALAPATIAALMGDDRASMVLTDPPYNVRVNGHVSGKGKRRHPEFAMASGEQSEAEFTTFLQRFLAAAAGHTRSGALLYVYMDWRHVFELMTAARAVDLTLINLCVWNKTNGGMGTLYRSKHELVLVFKAGNGPHRNNVELGRHGRSRTNVWDYAGANAFGRNRDAELDMHPTVKPVAMLADAIRDVTAAGDVVLDPFGGSGSTMIAAEQTGRRARLVEIDSVYGDVAIRRWQAFTGRAALLVETGETFEQVEERRAAEAPQGAESAPLPGRQNGDV